MYRRQLVGVIATVAFAPVAGCSTDETATESTDEPTPTGGGPTTDAETTQPMNELTLESPTFDPGASIPDKYGKDYQNVNPPLVIAGVPDGARSLVLIMDDPDAPGGTFLHWLVWNIPPDIGDIPAAWEPPEGVVQGENDFGNFGYGGPKPPSEHTYRFRLYAVDTTLDLGSSADQQAVEDAIDGRVLAQTRLTGTFAP